MVVNCNERHNFRIRWWYLELWGLQGKSAPLRPCYGRPHGSFVATTMIAHSRRRDMGLQGVADLKSGRSDCRHNNGSCSWNGRSYYDRSDFCF